jgi:hypothetical protein
MFASITHIPSLHKILSNMPEHKLTMFIIIIKHLFVWYPTRSTPAFTRSAQHAQLVASYSSRFPENMI